MFLEIKHLRTLNELAAAGSLAGAAERLHLTQSALSHQLKALEQQLDLALFERKSRPLRLTPAGERLLALAHNVLPAINETKASLRRMAAGEVGRLHTVVECHSCFDWLLPTIEVYRPQWPDVHIDLITSKTFDALPALSEGQVDLVITSDPNDDAALVFEPLFDFQILLAVAPDHALSKRAYATPADLADQTLLTYPVDPQRLDIFRHFLNPAEVMPARVQTAELSVMMLEQIKRGLAVAALPSWVLAAPLAAGEIAARPLGQAGIWATLYAAVRCSARPLRYLGEFIETSRAIARERLRGIGVPQSQRPESTAKDGLRGRRAYP
jgi:LysR family transcriptional regulator for metE and metH